MKYPGRLPDAQKEQASHRHADGKGHQSQAWPLPTLLPRLCSSADTAPRRILGLQDAPRDAAHRIAEGRRDPCLADVGASSQSAIGGLQGEDDLRGDDHRLTVKWTSVSGPSGHVWMETLMFNARQALPKPSDSRCFVVSG